MNSVFFSSALAEEATEATPNGVAFCLFAELDKLSSFPFLGYVV